MTTTKENKTNIQHLRELLTKGHEERIEFLEAVETELKVKKDRIVELEEDLEDAKDNSDDEDSEMNYENTIDTGMEPLHWSCPNLGIMSMMETFEEKLTKHGHIKMETLLKAL